MVHHVLVIGAGSAGKRHAQNLSSLGCAISAVDPRQDRRAEIADCVGVVRVGSEVEEVLDRRDAVNGVVIASPPSFHVQHAVQALRAGKPVLLEKPVAPSASLAEGLADEAAATAVPVLVGYTWRWSRALRRVRQLLEDGAIGRLLYVRAHISAHLADWHPWERYQDFFMSRADLGGGALLDESHWLDLMLWMFGPPDVLFARVSHLSSLEIDTDDSVDMILEFGARCRGLVHLDLFGRPHQKVFECIGESGTLIWTESNNSIAISGSSVSAWNVETFTEGRNDMFTAEAQEFIEVMDGAPPRTCTLDDGVRVLSLIEAARISSASGSLVRLAGM